MTERQPMFFPGISTHSRKAIWSILLWIGFAFMTGFFTTSIEKASVNAMLSIIMGLLFGLGVIGIIGIIYISKVLARFDRTR